MPKNNPSAYGKKSPKKPARRPTVKTTPRKATPRKK